MKSIILLVFILSITVNINYGQETCPSDNNPCTSDVFIYGGCFHIYNQWVDCESTNEYKACVANCKNSPSYSPCSSVSCNYETMQCEFGRHWSGCNDFNKCTQEYCNSTTGCVRSNINCYDGLVSTTDNCDQTFGCYYGVNPAINGVTSCTTNSHCNDNRVCTSDTCVAGKCQYAINCPSGYLCNSSGTCAIIPQVNN